MDAFFYNRALLPKLSYSRHTIAHQLFYLNYLGLPVHFASARHRNLIAEQVPLFVFVSSWYFRAWWFAHGKCWFFSNSTLRIQSNPSVPSKLTMHLSKDNSIVVTKTAHTAEKFIQKKIELLVRWSREISSTISLFFSRLEWWIWTFLCCWSWRCLQQTHPLVDFNASCNTTLWFVHSFNRHFHHHRFSSFQLWNVMMISTYWNYWRFSELVSIVPAK